MTYVRIKPIFTVLGYKYFTYNITNNRLFRINVHCRWTSQSCASDESTTKTRTRVAAIFANPRVPLFPRLLIMVCANVLKWKQVMFLFMSKTNYLSVDV